MHSPTSALAGDPLGPPTTSLVQLLAWACQHLVALLMVSTLLTRAQLFLTAYMAMAKRLDSTKEICCFRLHPSAGSRRWCVIYAGGCCVSPIWDRRWLATVGGCSLDMAP